MADITYPSNLPQFVLGKEREQAQSFEVEDVFAGPGYTRKITDDNPVTWKGSVTCTNQVMARQFIAFVKSVKNSASFNMPILTEYGLVDHEVRFLIEPTTPTQISPTAWQYEFTIFARELLNPDDDIENDLLLAMWLGSACIIDVAVNSILPEA